MKPPVAYYGGKSTAGRDTEDREATRTEVIWSNRPLVEPGAFDFGAAP